MQRVHEYTGDTTKDWQQEYSYDRYGNRSINQAGTTQAVGINSMQAAVVANTTTNRLYAPGETESNHPLIDYDNAGNQKKDYYSASGVTYDRLYDGENRMTSSTATFTSPAATETSTYTYDADGRRVKRSVAGQPSAVETWQVYGIGGELLAEYAANTSPASPQKEYGYRNGQLLITAEASSSSSRTNYAAATNGATASASSEFDAARGASAAINGDRKAQHWASDPATGSGWLSATTGAAWLEVDFSGSKSIDELDIFTVQDNYSSPAEPTEAMTFSLYGLSGYDVQYWNGSAWTTVTGGSIGGNNKVWKKVTFATVTTTKIRVSTNASADGYSRIAELEAWGAGGQTQNVVWTNAVGVSTSGNSLTKTAATGWGNAGASSTQTLTAGDGYVEATVAELGSSRIFGFSHTDTNQSWDTIDFGLHCADDANNTIYVYESGTQRGTFGSYASGDKLRVAIVGGVVKYSRNGTVFYTSTVTPSYPLRVDSALYENAATIGNAIFSSGSIGSSSNINWLVTDQLGTPRMIFDQTGALATTKRHDYLPFGEELAAGQGVRNTTPGYGSSDGVRQKFTQYEADGETGLNFAQARYQSSAQGRFTSVDPLMASARGTNPQSWNRYSYVLNKPLNLFDPSGLAARSADGGCSAEFGNCGGNESGSEGEKAYEDRVQHTHNAMAATTAARNDDWETFDELMLQDQSLEFQIPTDPNTRAILETLMGEATPWGWPTYEYANNRGGGRSNYEAARHPDGRATRNDIYFEMEMMVSVFVNRQNASGGKLSFYDIANTKQTNGRFQFEGYPNGKDRLNNLGARGSEYYERARDGIRAINYVLANGPLRNDISYWKAVLQTDASGDFVRVRQGAYRVAGTDFYR